MHNQSDPCPCSSGKNYGECCQSLHQGNPTENALALMRSRYSAYAIGDADYIMRTTHPDNAGFSDNTAIWKEQIQQFCSATTFEKLAILDFQDGNDTAYVTFTAYLRQNGQDATFTEKSRFKKIKGQWLYESGTISK